MLLITTVYSLSIEFGGRQDDMAAKSSFHKQLGTTQSMLPPESQIRGQPLSLSQRDESLGLPEPVFKGLSTCPSSHKHCKTKFPLWTTPRVPTMATVFKVLSGAESTLLHRMEVHSDSSLLE